MLYHLDDPVGAVAEARRVLRPDGVFFACTTSRNNDPEVIRWDASLVQIPDRKALARYLRSHGLPPDKVERVSPPITLTKRGCLVLGHK
jgi:SAM-dependent methyltransferase